MWFKATLFTILIVTSTGNHCSVWFTCRVQSFGVAKKLDITLYGTVALNCHLVVKYVCPLQLHFYWALPIHCISDIWYRVLSSKKKPYRQKNNKNHISHQFYYTVLRIYGARFCPPHLNHIGGKTVEKQYIWPVLLPRTYLGPPKSCQYNRKKPISETHIIRMQLGTYFGASKNGSYSQTRSGPNRPAAAIGGADFWFFLLSLLTEE